MKTFQHKNLYETGCLIWGQKPELEVSTQTGVSARFFTVDKYQNCGKNLQKCHNLDLLPRAGHDYIKAKGATTIVIV